MFLKAPKDPKDPPGTAQGPPKATREAERNFEASPGQAYQPASPYFRLIDVRQTIVKHQSNGLRLNGSNIPWVVSGHTGCGIISTCIAMYLASNIICFDALVGHSAACTAFIGPLIALSLHLLPLALQDPLFVYVYIMCILLTINLHGMG